MIFYYVINDNIIDHYDHKYLYLDFDAFQLKPFGIRALEQHSDFVFSVNDHGQPKWIKNRVGNHTSSFDDEFLILVKLSSIKYT